MSEPTCEHASLMRYTCAVCAERDLAAARARIAELEADPRRIGLCTLIADLNYTIGKKDEELDRLRAEVQRLKDSNLLLDGIAGHDIKVLRAEADRLRAQNARLTERYNWDHASCNAWRADAEKQIQRLQEENELLAAVNLGQRKSIERLLTDGGER